MNGFTDLMSTNIENNRNQLRRIARHDDQEFSNQSILNAMEKFVRTVNAMEETILVPSRLMDRQVGDSTDTVPATPETTTAHHHHQHGGKKRNITIRERLHASDLFTLYTTLNSVKVDLLWGRNDEGREAEDEETTIVVQSTHPNVVVIDEPMNTDCTAESTLSVKSTGSSNTEKGHNRRPSNVSMSSSNSTSTLSDTESDISNENDSGVESEDKKRAKSLEEQKRKDKSAAMAKQFRSHLIGLYRNLDQMTEAANYLMERYQSDFGPV